MKTVGLIMTGFFESRGCRLDVLVLGWEKMIEKNRRDVFMFLGHQCKSITLLELPDQGQSPPGHGAETPTGASQDLLGLPDRIKRLLKHLVTCDPDV